MPEPERQAGSTMKNQGGGLTTQTWVAASFLLMAVAMISKVLGIVRDILIAKFFGASAELDSFMVALSIPVLPGRAIGIALSTALIPVYRKVLTSSGALRANAMASTAVTATMALSVIVLLVPCIAPAPFIKLVAPSLSASSAVLAADLTRWTCLFTLGMNLTYILTAVYHSQHHFKIPAFSDLAFNCTLILLLTVLAAPFGIQALLASHLVGILLCAAIQIFFFVTKRLPGFRPSFHSTDLQPLLAVAFPILIIEFSTQSPLIIENYFAAGLGEGAISALNFAKRFSAGIVTLVAISVARGAYPTLAKLESEKYRQEAKRFLVKIVKQIIIVFVPVSVLLVSYNVEIVQLVFMRGSFDARSVQMTSSVLRILAAGFVLIAVEPLLIRACYALSFTGMPLVAAVVSMLFLIPMNYVLTPLLGISGIALTAVLTYLLRLSLLAMYLRLKLEGLGLRELARTFAASLIAALTAYAFTRLVGRHDAIGLLLVIMTFFPVYVAVGWRLMNKDMKALFRLLKMGLFPESNPP